MAARPTTLAVENLESRFNLSTLLGHLPTGDGVGTFLQDRALFSAKTTVISLSGSDRGTLEGTMHKKGQVALVARPGSTSPAPAVSVTASTKAITVMWVNNSTNVTGFKIERSTDGTNYGVIGSAGAGKSTYTDKTAVEGVKYVYRVTAYNKTSSTSSTESSQVALEPLPPPAAPTGLVVSKSTATSISLSWKDNASNESGFHLYRSTDGQTYTLVASMKANTKTYTDSQLTAGQTYYYELSAWSPNGEAYAAIPFTASTTQAAPVAPGNLTFSGVTSGGLTVSWSEASTNVDGFKVFRSTDGKAFTQVGTVTSGTTSFADTGLAAGTGYAYEVSAFNKTSSEMSKAATVSTLQAVPATPAAPSNLAFSNVTSSSLTLSWTSNSTTQTGFVVYRSTDGAHFVAVTTTGANDSHFNDTNLSAGTTYWYKVAAGNTGGQGLSTATSVLTATPVAPPVTPPVTTPSSAPAAPASLNFTGVTATGLTLHWTEAASGQTGFHVYRSTDGVNFTLMATLAPGENAWMDSNLSASTGYAYQVSAFNLVGETRSTAATVSTLAGPPAAPTNLNFTSVTASGVTLNWTAPASGGQSGFRIYRTIDGTNYTLVSTAGASSTTWTDSGLASATTYGYEVAAYNAGGETRSAAQPLTTAAAVVVTPPVTGGTPTFAIKNMTSFNELVITATTGNDSILVTQSNGTLNITANGATYTYTNTFGDMKIYGVGGNDSITVNSSVNINTLIYGGDGNDTILNQTTGKATIVTIGNGVNNVTGNGVNTAYWVNSGDTVHATTAEMALGGVNRVTGFYNGVTRSLAGQNLTDPTDSGTEKRLTNSSLWGTGAVMNDIVQTGLADCYFLAPLASLANNEPQKLMNMGVDLGDGTYAFRFVRGGTTTFVRVDSDLATGYWNYGLANATPDADGNQWGSLFEKAYAEFRTGANTYASLNWGSQSQTFSDLGVASSGLSPSATSSTALASTINTNLAANHAVVASTNGTIKNNAPLIYSHVYSVIGAYTNSSGTVMIQLRNPWGVDGAGNDGNTNDAIVTVDYATFIANFGSLNYATA